MLSLWQLVSHHGARPPDTHCLSLLNYCYLAKMSLFYTGLGNEAVKEEEKKSLTQKRKSNNNKRLQEKASL